MKLRTMMTRQSTLDRRDTIGLFLLLAVIVACNGDQTSVYILRVGFNADFACTFYDVPPGNCSVGWSWCQNWYSEDTCDALWLAEPSVSGNNVTLAKPQARVGAFKVGRSTVRTTMVLNTTYDDVGGYVCYLIPENDNQTGMFMNNNRHIKFEVHVNVTKALLYLGRRHFKVQFSVADQPVTRAARAVVYLRNFYNLACVATLLELHPGASSTSAARAWLERRVTGKNIVYTLTVAGEDFNQDGDFLTLELYSGAVRIASENLWELLNKNPRLDLADEARYDRRRRALAVTGLCAIAWWFLSDRRVWQLVVLMAVSMFVCITGD